MQPQGQISQILTTKFAEARLRNPSYSLRAYAQKLGVSSGALSEIMVGRRGLSRTKAEQIAENLALNPVEMESFLAEVITLRGKAKKSKEAGKETSIIPIDQFSLISDWIHYGILSLIRLKGCKSEPHWIGRRLGISESKAAEAIKRLERLGMIEITSSGKLKRRFASLDTGDHVSSIAIRLAHEQNLELAKRSLERQSTAVRDFTISTFTVDRRKLPRLKKLIRDFQDLIEEEGGGAEATDVYRLSIQLFPLTEIENEV